MWTVTDCAGNTTSHAQLLTVVDTDAPVFTTGPLDALVECDAVPAPADITALQANDNCDEALTYTYEGETFQDGDCANGYTLLREWSATDCSGNSTSWVQTLTVVDTQAPSLDVTFEDGTAAHDTTVSCLDEVPTLSASTSDSCDDAPMLSASTDTLAIDGCGNATLAFHFESEDACGNLTSADFTVTVLDEIAPTWLDVCGVEDEAPSTSAPKTTTATACCHPLSRATCPPRTTAEATWPSTWPPRWWAPTPPTTVWTSTARR